jgi:hypothetical protein
LVRLRPDASSCGVKMPNLRARSQEGGGGIGEDGNEARAQGGQVSAEDEEMRDIGQEREETSPTAEKRKRDSPHKNRITRAPAVREDDPESATEMTASGRIRRLSRRALEARQATEDMTPEGEEGGSTPSLAGNQETRKTVSVNDIMAWLMEKDKKEAEEKKKTQEKEKAYQEEIHELKAMVTTLALDLKVLQQGVPNWGSLESLERSSSQPRQSGGSYAEVAQRGVSLGLETASPRRGSIGSGSRVSFSDDIQTSDTSPRRSPPESTALRTSIRSAMKSTTSERAGKTAQLAIDLKDAFNSTQETNGLVQIKQTITKAIQSIEGLEKIELRGFRVRHTNKDVNFAHFTVQKETEEKIRQEARRWTQEFIPGAKLIGPKWYTVKADFIDRVFARDSATGQISEEARRNFEEENGVKVNQMKWLGTPKEHALYGSAVIKLASREDADRLLSAEMRDEDVTLQGCAVTISHFEDRRGPLSCFKCQQYGHISTRCTNEERCPICAGAHKRCNSTQFRCVNCGGAHRSFEKTCPAFMRQAERINSIRLHV